MVMEFFTIEHRAGIEKKYGNRNPRPAIFTLTTLEGNQNEREEIERALGLLSENTKKKVWKEINDSKLDDANLHGILAELQTGVWLTMHYGDLVIFKPKIVSKTPDWGLFTNGDFKALIEVRNLREPGRQKLVREKGAEMIPEILRLVLLPADLSVMVDKYPTANAQSIADDVTSWLQDDFARCYDHASGGFIFNFNGWIPGAQHARNIGYSYATHESPIKLIDVIDEKLDKYHSLLAEKKIPFYLFIINSFMSPVQGEEAQMLLWGRSCEEHTFEGSIIYSHGLDGLFYDKDKRGKVKYLSGVAMIPERTKFEKPLIIENRWAAHKFNSLITHCAIPTFD